MSIPFNGGQEYYVNNSFIEVINNESLPKIAVTQEMPDSKIKRLRQLDDCEKRRQKIAVFLGIIGFLAVILVISLRAMGQNGQYPLIHNHPVLDYISEHRVQKGGIIATPKGDISAVDLAFTNLEGKSLSDVLYQTQRRRAVRVYQHKKRIKFIIGQQTWFPSINLIKFNMKLDNSLENIQKLEQSAAYDRLQAKYWLSEFKQELPICAVVRSYNNNAFMRIEYNLNSIFTQNYTNYMAVIINDASNDGSDIIYRKYFDFFEIPKNKYVYIQNHVRKTALQNTYNAIHEVCSNDSIVLIIDGDDELIGKNVFKLFNAFHQKYKSGWIYSNFYRYVLSQEVIQVGYSKAYNLQQKKTVSFRQDHIKSSHLRSFPAKVFKGVPVQNFKDKNGNFFKVTEDIAIFLPVSEMACGRVYWIPEINYLYNGDTGLNDWKLHGAEQLIVEKQIRSKKKCQCLPEYSNLPLYT